MDRLVESAHDKFRQYTALFEHRMAFCIGGALGREHSMFPLEFKMGANFQNGVLRLNIDNSYHVYSNFQIF